MILIYVSMELHTYSFCKAFVELTSGAGPGLATSRWLSNIDCPPSVVRCLPPAISRPPPAVPPSAVRRPLPAIRRPQSAIRRPPSSVRHAPSALRSPPLAVRRPPGTRLPSFNQVFLSQQSLRECAGRLTPIKHLSVFEGTTLVFA